MDKKTTRFIMNQLRQASVKWYVRQIVLEKARKKVFEGRRTKAGKKIFKYYWQCAACEEYFRDQSQVEVDHIEEVGPFLGNWDKWIRRLFCALENLRVLCIPCHMRKTRKYANARAKYKRL